MAATKKKTTKKAETKKAAPEPVSAKALADQLIAVLRAQGSGRAVNYVQRAKASMRS